jgi:type VI secretion system protein ImpH
MAGPDGRETAGLDEDLFESPHRFDFFQAVRLLEHLERARARLNSAAQRRPVGHDSPGQELVAFRALPSLSFPAGPISRIDNGLEDEFGAPTFELVVTFLGLTGPNGVLPRHYTELMIQRVREGDTSLRDFLDLFHHRLISLFFRAWEKYRLPIGYERSQLDDRSGQPDLVTQSLYCLVGMGTNALRGRLKADDVDDEVFLHYSGMFAHYPRSALALECLLEDYLRLPTQVLQVQGQWLLISREEQARMPSKQLPQGRNNELGVSVIVGQRVWDIQGKFRIKLGPLTWKQFRALMPHGKALRPLCQLTRSFVGPDLDFDVQPLVKGEEVPPSQLSRNKASGMHLAWNTWVRAEGRPFQEPVDDAVFTIKKI